MKNKVLACLAAGLFAAPIHAALVVTMTEVGGNVELKGEGTAIVPVIGAYGFTGLEMIFRPSDSLFVLGSTPLNSAGPNVTAIYQASGPYSLGTPATNFFPTTGSGDAFGIYTTGTPGGVYLVLPKSYVSGSQLESTNVYNGQSFATLGVTPGTYVWKWITSGTNTDSLTLNIVETTTAPPVPLPAAAWLLLSGLAGLGVVGRRKRPDAV